MAITEDLFKVVYFRTPTPSADIWWLLKHVWSAQVDGTHPTGMLSGFLIEFTTAPCHDPEELWNDSWYT